MPCLVPFQSRVNSIGTLPSGATVGTHREQHRPELRNPRAGTNAFGTEHTDWIQEKIQLFNGVLTQDHEYRIEANRLVEVASQVCAHVAVLSGYQGSRDADLGSRLNASGSHRASAHYFADACLGNKDAGDYPPILVREAGSKHGCSRHSVRRVAALEGFAGQLEVWLRG